MEKTFTKKALDQYVKSFGLAKALHEIKPHMISDDHLKKLWENLINQYVLVVNYVRS